MSPARTADGEAAHSTVTNPARLRVARRLRHRVRAHRARGGRARRRGHVRSARSVVALRIDLALSLARCANTRGMCAVPWRTKAATRSCSRAEVGRFVTARPDVRCNVPYAPASASISSTCACSPPRSYTWTREEPVAIVYFQAASLVRGEQEAPRRIRRVDPEGGVVDLVDRDRLRRAHGEGWILPPYSAGFAAQADRKANATIERVTTTQCISMFDEERTPMLRR